MNIFTVYKEYLKKKDMISKVKILPCGGFELESKFLFEDKEKTLKYCKSLRKVLYKRVGEN